MIDLTRKLDPTRLVTFVIGTDMEGDKAVSWKNCTDLPVLVVILSELKFGLQPNKLP